MTVFFASDRAAVDPDDYRSPVGMDRLPEEVLAPIMAGAYARGVAETFDLLGLPALFLDGDGRVLHASRAATTFICGPLRLRTHHVIADEVADNRVLSGLIATALASDARLTSACLPQSAVIIHALPLPDRLRATGQMLRAVLLISTADDSLIALLARRMEDSAS